MKNYLSFFILVLLVGCTTNKIIRSETSDSKYQSYISGIQKQYAPDQRTALFQVSADGNVLKGETNIQEAKSALVRQLNAANISFIDSITILPAAGLQGIHQAVVTLSVANLRTQGRHQAELATQATLGTPLSVLKQERGWYLVQTPDKYIAWVDGGAIRLMNNNEFSKWQQSQKILYTNPYGFAYALPDVKGATVSDLVFGDVLELKKQEAGFYEAIFPDGRIGFIPANEASTLKEWASTRQPTEQNLVETAKRLMGLPYLWGGTSFKGVDCSGFTKTVYFMNGLVLPRDASQQVHIGEEVNTTNGWDNLKPGDLLFFGVPGKDGKPERVIHVGMWIGGNKEFIHSSSQVRISSFDASAANFEESEMKRFLRAKRISPQASLYDLRVKSFY